MSHSPAFQPNSQARPAVFCVNCAQIKPLPNSEFLARAVLITGIALAVFALLIFSVVTSPLAVVSPFMATICLTAAVTGISMLFTYFMMKSFGTGRQVGLSRKKVEPLPLQLPPGYPHAVGGSPAAGSPIPGSPRMQGQQPDSRLDWDQYHRIKDRYVPNLREEDFFNLCADTEQFILNNQNAAGKGKEEAVPLPGGYSMYDPRYYLFSNPPQQY